MNKKIIICILVVVAIGAIIGAVCILNKSDDDPKEDKEDKVTTTSKKTEEENEKEEEEEKKDELKTEDVEKEKKEDNTMYNSGKHHAKIEVKDYGTIELELDADTAPITVENFAKLVNERFYDGLTFHRIIDGFMIQGGDPLGNGTGGSDKEIKGEFSSNGIKNNISHVRGVISMARAMDPNSASSQFFIVHEDSTFLDGEYAGFGKVTSGMEIVDKICKDTPVVDNNGTVLKEKQPIIEKITMID